MRDHDETHELHRFAAAFASEDALRKHVATLLNKMPRTQGVQITHGTQEYGKDIIFYAPDGFQDFKLNACVIKNAKISGAADDNAGARTVFLQAEQALDTPLINSAGDNEYVSKVFIISPFECSQTTMRSIQGKLKSNFGKVEFLCGSRLFEKFSKFWPEFVIFESSLLGTYVAALQQSFDQSDPMTFLASQHYIFSTANKTLRSVYVRQGFKISLQEVDLLVGLPSLQLLKGAVGLGEIEQISEELLFTAGLLRQLQVWEAPDEIVARRLSESMTMLSKKLKDAWLNEWSQFESTYTDAGKRPPSRGVTQLLIKGVDKLLDTGNVALMYQVLRAFEGRVRKANELTKRARVGAIALHSEDYRSYCRVREVVRSHPAAFRKVPQPVEKRFPETLLDQIDKSTLITAPAGYGKTSFCKWNTLNDVQRLIEKTSNTIPVYVPLHQLATANLASCESAFLRTPDAQELFNTAQKSGQRVRVYLDGLDEVTTAEQQEKLMRLAAEMETRYPRVQIVVTARDYVSGPWLRWLSRLHISELDEHQIKQLVLNWLGEDAVELESFQKQFSKASPLQALMQIPLLGTLIIAVFKKMKSLPESKVKLYEVFVELMCGGWDLAKNVRRETRFGSQMKLGVLTRIAGLLHLNSKREAQEVDIRTAVKHTVPAFLEQWRRLLDEILEDGLLIRLGANNLAFSHLSFQEYLAATELTDPNGARQQVIVKRYLSGDDWWREVLAFYVGMSRRPDETEGWIRKATVAVSQTSHIPDLPQRSRFLVDTLASSCPGWTPRSDTPVLATSYTKSQTI